MTLKKYFILFCFVSFIFIFFYFLLLLVYFCLFSFFKSKVIKATQVGWQEYERPDLSPWL